MRSPGCSNLLPATVFSTTCLARSRRAGTIQDIALAASLLAEHAHAFAQFVGQALPDDFSDLAAGISTREMMKDD